MTNINTKIGLEVHAVITAAKLKMFSHALNSDNDASPNSSIDLVDIGLPGALPVLNPEAVFHAIRACLALNMTINEEFKFDRKLYYFQDLPLGYQITQFFKPIGINGHLASDSFNVKIRQLHMEIDASKIVRDDKDPGVILLDHNRSGCPLMEIVTEPDFKNADEVISFLKMLRSTLKYINVCDCKMECGHFRCDVNISINNGNRVEVKNLNSDDAIRKAIAYEQKRQLAAEKNNNPVHCETRGFNGVETTFLRKKESADDYMYFNEPDLPTFHIDPVVIEQQRRSLYKLPIQLYEDWKKFNLPKDGLEAILRDPNIIKLIQLAIDGQDIETSKIVFKIILGDIFAKMNEDGDDSIMNVNAKHIQKLAQYIKKYNPNSMIIKQVFDKMWITDEDPIAIIQDLDLTQITDISAIEEIVDKILQQNSTEVDKYINGNNAMIGFFIGSMMKQTNNRVSGDLAKKVLMRKLQNLQ